MLWNIYVWSCNRRAEVNLRSQEVSKLGVLTGRLHFYRWFWNFLFTGRIDYRLLVNSVWLLTSILLHSNAAVFQAATAGDHVHKRSTLTVLNDVRRCSQFGLQHYALRLLSCKSYCIDNWRYSGHQIAKLYCPEDRKSPILVDGLQPNRFALPCLRYSLPGNLDQYEKGRWISDVEAQLLLLKMRFE